MVNLIKKTLESLRNQNITTTPKNYEKEFYLQSLNSGIIVDDIIELNTFIKNLSPDEKELIKKNKYNTYYEIAQVLNSRLNNSDLARFINHLKNFLKPSIDQSIINDIDSLITELTSHPEKLTKDTIINRLEIITENRVSNDRKAVKETAKDVGKIANLLGKYFDKSLIQSEDTNEELLDIKNEIDSLHLSEQNIREIVKLQSKLVDTVHQLENTLKRNKDELIKGQDDCKYLQNEVTKLQENLEKFEKEKNIDFLTGITNRRGFIDAVEKIENEFDIFKSKYALIFFDLDHFKEVNDKYGHDCGDSILTTFASILDSLTRVNDVVSRYGGEEFIALIHYQDKNDVINYIARVKSIITTNRFRYENLKIKVEFSAGVAFREQSNSYKETLKKADKLLYDAKHDGRNKIIFEDMSQI